MGTASPARRRRRYIRRMIVAKTTQRNVFAKRDSANWETRAGEVQLTVKNRTRTRTKKAARQALSLPPRGENQGRNKPRRHWSHPSLHPPSHFKLSYVVLRMLQYPANSCTSVWDAVGVTRHFPSFQENWGENSASTSPWQGKNGGREGGGWREEGAMSDLIR